MQHKDLLSLLMTQLLLRGTLRALVLIFSTIHVSTMVVRPASAVKLLARLMSEPSRPVALCACASPYSACDSVPVVLTVKAGLEKRRNLQTPEP